MISAGFLKALLFICALINEVTSSWRNRMMMPKCLREFLIGITPEEAKELWDYFDGCSNEGLIEIVANRALQSSAIAKERAGARMSFWRVGKSYPINVYEDDRPICQCHTAVDAQRLVAAMNGIEQDIAHHAEGCDC